MLRFRTVLVVAFVGIVLGSPLAAQIALPQTPGIPVVGSVLDGTLETARGLVRGTTAQVAKRLRDARLSRIDDLLRRNRSVVERDSAGQPARRGVLLAIDPDNNALAKLAASGFVSGNAERLGDLGITIVELAVPAGMGLADAERLAVKAAPGLTISSDPLYFQSGASASSATVDAAERREVITVPIGLIDGAPAQSVVSLRGFAAGAPTPSNHGSAVASLATRAGATTIHVADVFGKDPAGGNALAIARGMNWLIGEGARVVSISLVGPRNPVLERAVIAARARQIVVVAAVGNDGPAAPPSYPASYRGVIAVTGVDKRNRPLIEAGKALHLDYAAPGADLNARNAAGKWVAVRGTSYAAPLAAVRAAAALQRGADTSRITVPLDAEARPLARNLPDPRSGRGLLCEWCR